MENAFNKRQFGLRLKEIRKSKGLTQEEICEITGIDVSNYSKMETGKIMPSLASLQKLVLHAGFVPNEMFEYDHLEKEEIIDEKVHEMYQKFSIKQKKSLYKVMRIIEEQK